MEVRIKKNTDSDMDVKAPLVTEGNACFDFYAPRKFVVPPFTFGYKAPTGLSFELPKGFHMELFLRSSYGAKRCLRLSNGVGVIDNSYRGEVCGLFDNPTNVPEIIEQGDRFLQGQIKLDQPHIDFKSVETLTETQRGAGGFGSTGE